MRRKNWRLKMSHHPQVLAYAFGREHLQMLNNPAATNMVVAHHHGGPPNTITHHQPANLVRIIGKLTFPKETLFISFQQTIFSLVQYFIWWNRYNILPLIRAKHGCIAITTALINIYLKSSLLYVSNSWYISIVKSIE